MTRTPHEHRLRMADAFLTVMIIIVAIPFAVMLAREYADHKAWCALSNHTINCGD